MFTAGLAQFIGKTRYQDLPPEVVTAAKLAILDFTGVAMAGSQQPSGRIICQRVKENQSIPEATIIGARFKAGCSLAALANGNCAHVLDYDDCLDFPNAGLGHPSTGILPAALAVSEKLHLSGRDLITAYCLGLEAYAKTGLLCRESRAGARGWEWSGVLGVMGATTAVAKLLKLDENKTRMSLGVAASLSSGLMRNFGTMAGHLHSGNAARNAVDTGLLVQQGFTGYDDIIETPSGFYSAYTGSQTPVSAEGIRENLKALGNPWNIIDPGLMFKAFPCAHISHFGVDAGLQLRKQHAIDWQQIAEIEFRIPPMIKGASTYQEPQTGVQGKFSLGYCLCRALIAGKVQITDFTDDAVKDPDTRRLMGKIKWVDIEQDTKAGPFGHQEVTLKMKDGNTYGCKVDHPRGEPQNPQSAEEFAEKYRDCALHAHYDEQTLTGIKDLILDLENVSDVAQVTDLIGR